MNNSWLLTASAARKNSDSPSSSIVARGNCMNAFHAKQWFFDSENSVLKNRKSGKKYNSGEYNRESRDGISGFNVAGPSQDWINDLNIYFSRRI